MAKKRLVIVTVDYFHPVGHRLHHLLPYLKDAFDIKIITIVSPLYDIQNIEKMSWIRRFKIWFYEIVLLKRKKIIQLKDDVVLIRNIPMAERNAISKFCVYSFIVPFFLRKVFQNGKTDAILTITPYPSFSLFMARLKIPVIYEDTDRFEFFEERKLKKFMTRKIEKFCIMKSNAVISAGYKLTESAMVIKRKDVYCIPNGAKISLIKYCKSRRDLVYVGGLESIFGLDTLIRAVDIARQSIPELKITLIGAGNELQYLKNLVENLKLEENVIFFGKVKHDEIPSLLQKFAIGIATYPNSKLMQYAFTLKLIEYMAAGLPIIATDVGDTGKLISNYNCGILVNHTPEAIAKGICNLVLNQEQLELLANNGIQAARGFDWSNLARNEIEIIKSYMIK